jgi:hypothetical protein
MPRSPYRMLYGTYNITEIDEFDPDHEYEDLKMNDLDGLDLKGKMQSLI